MTRARRSPVVLWLLLAAALCMRALVPQGYMPERSADGAIAVRVCGSDHVLLLPLGKEDGPGKADGRAQPPCAFAGLATPAVPPPAVAELPVPAPAEPAFAPAELAAAWVADPLRLPPVRGPPPPA